ncbi:hypothetical protein VYU27_006144 [Nannochloropsis oceanica]
MIRRILGESNSSAAARRQLRLREEKEEQQQYEEQQGLEVRKDGSARPLLGVVAPAVDELSMTSKIARMTRALHCKRAGCGLRLRQRVAAIVIVDLLLSCGAGKNGLMDMLEKR